MSCGVGCRRGSDPALLWLWYRLAATAPIRPLAWEPPYAEGVAKRNSKDKKTKKQKKQFRVSKIQTLIILAMPLECDIFYLYFFVYSI